MQETWVWSLGWEDPLEKGMPTHSSVLAWKIPWTEDPGGLQSMGSQRLHRTEWLAHTHTGYKKKKINTQKSVAFLYSNNQRSEREIKERISFTITSKRIKHIRINLPKETKDLYSEKCKTLLKEQRWHTQMRRYNLCLDWKNQYCQNDFTTKQSRDSM